MTDEQNSKNHIRLSELGDVLVVAAMRLLQERGDMPFGDLADSIEHAEQIPEWAHESYPSSGMPKWRNSMLDRVRRFIRAGLLLREGGDWALVGQAQDLLSEHPSPGGDEKIIAWVDQKLRGHQKQAPLLDGESEQAAMPPSDEFESESPVRTKVEEQAIAEIKKFIQGMDDYGFQKLVAALLRAMGYFVAFIAPRGKDGGVDIIANEDPLGKPGGARLKVAVKRYGKDKNGKDKKPDPKDLRELTNFLRHRQDVGVFVCSTSFTATFHAEANQEGKRVRLIDVDEFIRLWVEFYPNVGDERKRLPLYAVHFLDREGISGR